MSEPDTRPRITDTLEGNFYQVSNLIPQKYLKIIGPSAFALYSYLKSRANNLTGHTYPGYRKVTEETGLSTATISKGLKALVDAGLLRVERELGEVNHYIVLNPGISDTASKIKAVPLQKLKHPSLEIKAVPLQNLKHNNTHVTILSNNNIQPEAELPTGQPGQVLNPHKGQWEDPSKSTPKDEPVKLTNTQINSHLEPYSEDEQTYMQPWGKKRLNSTQRAKIAEVVKEVGREYWKQANEWAALNNVAQLTSIITRARNLKTKPKGVQSIARQRRPSVAPGSNGRFTGTTAEEAAQWARNHNGNLPFEWELRDRGGALVIVRRGT